MLGTVIERSESVGNVRNVGNVGNVGNVRTESQGTSLKAT
jgi:hypothetical protein